ncbi:MAG: TetR/AcrR family transcriptional regulator, partial [bacterium]
MPKLDEATRIQRRQLIIDAAWRCAARKGYEATTVDDVCSEAGVSKGAFYGYFEQKQDLLLALLDDDAGFYKRLIDRLSTSDIPGMRKLRGYTRAVAERSSDPARVQVTADLWAEMLTQPAVKRRFASAVQWRRERLRDWIEQGIAAAEMEQVPA